MDKREQNCNEDSGTTLLRKNCQAVIERREFCWRESSRATFFYLLGSKRKLKFDPVGNSLGSWPLEVK